MSRQRFEPTWPFLCILVCLFVLCAVSPSIWGTMLKRRTQFVADGIAKATSREDVKRTAAASDADLQTPSPTATMVSASQTTASQTPSVPEQTAADVQASNSHTADRSQPSAVGPRSDTAAELQPAPIAPPVANQALAPDVGAASAAEPNAARSAQEPSTPATPSPTQQKPAEQKPMEPSPAQQKPAQQKPIEPSPAEQKLPEQKPAEQKPSDGVSSLVVKVPQTQSLPVVDAAPAVSEASPSANAAGPGPVSAEDPTPARVAMRPRESRASDANTFESIRDLLLPQEPLPRGVSSPDAASRFRTPPADSTEPGVARPRWPQAKALAESLAVLSRSPASRGWAERVLQVLPRIAQAMEDAPAAAGRAIEEAAGLCDEARRLEQKIADPALAGALARTAHGLERRVAVWRRVAAAGGLTTALAGAHRNDPRRLTACLAALDTLTQDGASGRSWAQYLALDTLHQMADSTATSPDVARRVLDRLTINPMGRAQRRFASSEPVLALATELRHWAGHDVSVGRIVDGIERYESRQLPGDAKAVAEICRNLAMSEHRDSAEVAAQIESYYRNANVRLVVTRELLNRFIPERRPERDCVEDVVMGAPVHGQRTTTSKVGVQLIPDSQRLRLALEVTGEVSAETQSTSGPATFFNRSQSVYRAWKEIEIGADGLRIQPAEVTVDNDTALDDVQTNFDRIPLVGALAQEVARSQHAQRRGEMNSEVVDRVYQQAKEQVDTEVDARLKDFAGRIQSQLLDPLTDLSVGPMIIGAETTDRRIVLRMRIASEGQLGAHTPRPRAPADSAASLQVHQSAFNNLLEQLQLDGCSFRMSELRQRLAARTGQPQLAQGNDESDEISVTFASRDALQVQCDQGKLSITLSVARLEREGQHWDNFQVRAFYRPEIQQRAALLVREDSIHLLGDRLSARSQIALRGVFGRVFAKDRPLSLIPPRFANDPRLAKLIVSQFEIEQGWIAIALTEDRPDRPAAVTASRREAN